MICVWRILKFLYLHIPYSKNEEHIFRAFHNFFSWWMPGFIDLSIVTGTFIIIWVLYFLLGKFDWYDPDKLWEQFQPLTRKWAYYGLWLAYLIWIPLPWPRAAVLIWAITARVVYKHEWDRRRRHREWLAEREKAAFTVVQGEGLK